MADLLKNGTVLSHRYRVGRLLGSGGMGRVYEATHLLIHRTVALKTLHCVENVDERAIQRILQEARLVADIGNDHICEVIDMGTIDGRVPYFVMPRLTGQPLIEVLKKDRILPLERAVDIIRQTLAALEAIHKENIIHRDLKPDNIFITQVGDRQDFVKLLDFGLSKLIPEDGSLSLTTSGSVVGTPYYMAPEQAEGAKSLDHRVDIYAAGVLLYRMLTGNRPFEADSYNEIIAKILTKPFALPRRVNPTIPRSVERVILKAMARPPGKRYQSAGSMIEALDKAVGHRQQVSPPAALIAESLGTSQTLTDVSMPTLPKGHHRWFVPLAVLGALLLSIFLVWSALKKTLNTHSPEEEESVPSGLSLQNTGGKTAMDEHRTNTDPVDLRTMNTRWDTPLSRPSSAPSDEKSDDYLPPPRRATSKSASSKRRSAQKSPSKARPDPPTPKPAETRKKMVEGHNNSLFVVDYAE